MLRLNNIEHTIVLGPPDEETEVDVCFDIEFSIDPTDPSVGIMSASIQDMRVIHVHRCDWLPMTEQEEREYPMEILEQLGEPGGVIEDRIWATLRNQEEPPDDDWDQM